MSTFICQREIVVYGEAQPCDEPAPAIAYDGTWGEWYPVCARHRDRSLTSLLHDRPELHHFGHGFVQALGVAAA